MASVGGKQVSSGAANKIDTVGARAGDRRGYSSSRGDSGHKGGSGGGSDGGRSVTPAGGVIDLSSSSWDDDDPFLDSLEATEANQHAERANSRTGTGGVSRSIRPRAKVTGGNIRGSASSGATAAASSGGRRRPAAPLTSISALFGGGAGGNRANRAGSAPAPLKPRAGTKRPRNTPATGQGRMNPPPPLPATTEAGSEAEAAAFTASRGGKNGTQQDMFLGGDRDAGAFAGAWRGRGGQGRRRGGREGGVEDQLWPDKHRPRDVSDLAVHSRKVDEVRHWMTLALNTRPGSEGGCRLLALVGPPGTAKSTMVRLLAQDMDVELVEWQDTSGQGGPAYRPMADGPALVGERPRHELGSSYQSAIDSFEEFIRRSSYRSLAVLSIKSSEPDKRGSRTLGSGGGGGGWSSGAGAGGGSAERRSGGKRQRMVLIEDLPEVHGEEKKGRLRSLMAECARSSPCPIIICWSQASESSSYQSRLEQVLSRETLSMPGVQITTCNPINATLLRQHLKGVLALEGISDPKGTLVQSAITTCAGDIRHALLNLQMSVGVGGSIAAAFRPPNGVRKSKRAKERRDAGTAGSGGGSGVISTSLAAGGGMGVRDTFLTQFHALGKLLYAKRSPPAAAAASTKARRLAAPASNGVGEAGGGDGREPLAFDPEEVLSQGGMELDWALAFLQYHCVDFFTDESDLAQGLGYFSDADVFASRMFDTSRGYDGGGEQGVFPQRYAESIASRATAASNRQPAKNKMRSFGAPKSFEMHRARKEAAGALRRFVEDAWNASGGDVGALWAPSRHLKEAVDIDLLPAARLITGEWEAEVALRSLLHRFLEKREQGPLSQQQEQQQQQPQTGGAIAQRQGVSSAHGAIDSVPNLWMAGGEAGVGRGVSSVGGTRGDNGSGNAADCPGVDGREGAEWDGEDEIYDF